MQSACNNLCARFAQDCFESIGRYIGMAGKWEKSFSMLAWFMLCEMTEKHWHGNCSKYFQEIEK
jgi:hypothetical protein